MFDTFGPTPQGMNEASHPLQAPGLAEWERTYSMFEHLTLVATHLVPVPVIPALVMWLIKKDESAFVKDHGREAINFQLSLLLYALAGWPLTFLCGIGVLVWVAAYVLGIVGCILASVAANKGRYYRYPMCIRFIGP